MCTRTIRRCLRSANSCHIERCLRDIRQHRRNVGVGMCDQQPSTCKALGSGSRGSPTGKLHNGIQATSWSSGRADRTAQSSRTIIRNESDKKCISIVYEQEIITSSMSKHAVPLPVKPDGHAPHL